MKIDMEGNVVALERRYETLFDDFQAGKLDEPMFVAEVDKLQFRDDWGRYWMLGAQTGAWHYYDGQGWHQADPRDADNLPFLDEQGHYWQRGIKSGEWYYYDVNTGEWVKPGADDPSGPSAAQDPQWQVNNTASHYTPVQSQPMPSNINAPGTQDQFGTDLFQDDEGRYWAIGAKSQQWYFYDESGWHPAHEFQTRIVSQSAQLQYSDYGSQTPQAGYQTIQESQASQVYNTPPQSYYGQTQAEQPKSQTSDASRQSIPLAQTHTSNQQQPIINQQSNQNHPVYSQQPTYDQQQVIPQQQPVQNYTAQPGQSQSTQFSPGIDPTAEQMPPPPQGPSQSGTWYYFDDGQWLKYSTGEPAKDAPPDPAQILDQEAGSSPNKSESKSEPVIAELFEDDEPPIEVVDVEVITVVEPEPEPEPELEPEPKLKSAPEPRTKSKPTPKPEQKAEKVTETIPPPLPRRTDEVRPRRSKTAPIDPVDQFNADERPPRRRTEPTSPTESRPVPPKRRTESDPARPVTPRKKSGAHDPTIPMPAGSVAPNVITSPTSTKISRPSKPTLPEHRRAREATLPMNPTPVARSTEEASSPTPVARHRQVTQKLPKISPSVRPAMEPKSKTSTIQPSRQPVRDVGTPTPIRDRGQPVRDSGSRPLKDATRPLKEGGDSSPIIATPTKQSEQSQPQKEGYTLGDILRSFPSTLWTGLAGVAVMIIFAVLIVIAVTYGSSLFGVDDVAAVPNPTPTLNSGLAPDSTPTPGPTSANSQNEPIPTSTPGIMVTFNSPDLDFALEYPENWKVDETSTQAILAPSEEGLASGEIKATNMRIGLSDEESSISDLLTDALSAFPANAESLNEGTISIASYTWTSTQIRFEDEALGGQGIATVAVTNKDGQGYFLVAVAPANQWNSVQPIFQSMINSFKFGAEQTLAQAPSNAIPGSIDNNTTNNEDDDTSNNSDQDDQKANNRSTATPTPTPTPTPKLTATPLVYRIQSGDTLLGIAVKFGVDIELLAQENGIASPESLQIDQELVIPFTAEELAAYNTGNSGGSSAAEAASSSVTESVADTTADNPNEETGTSTDSATNETTNSSDEASETSAAAIQAASEPAPVSGRIVYPAYNPGQSSYDVWMVDLATGEQTPIAGNASQPAFNRDGTLLAYRSWDRSTRGIFFRDFVGGRGGIVTRFVEDALPTWSPDGYSFTFSSRKEGDRVPRIYIGNQLGEETFPVGFQGEYSDTFPDGRLIVKGCTPSGDCGLFVMGARGGGSSKISDEVSDTAPSVSPNGSKIAFMSSGRGANNWEIFVMNADGTNAIRLTENGNNDGLPTWSPDGQSIAFASDRGGVWAIWVMNPDGSNQRKLFDMKGSPEGKVLHDEPNSRGWLEERISWAP